MDEYQNSDNFQRMVGCKMISPHHFHSTNGVRPADSYIFARAVADGAGEEGISRAETQRRRGGYNDGE